jgi:hypothetical protein
MEKVRISEEKSKKKKMIRRNISASIIFPLQTNAICSYRFCSSSSSSISTTTKRKNKVSPVKVLFTELQLPKTARRKFYRETGIDEETVDEKAPIYLVSFHKETNSWKKVQLK